MTDIWNLAFITVLSLKLSSKEPRQKLEKLFVCDLLVHVIKS